MKGSRWIGAGLGIVALVVFLLLPPFEPVTKLGMKVLGVFVFTVLWWVFVDTGFSSFLCIALFALAGIMEPREVFSASWGSWLVIFLIGCFGLTGGYQTQWF